MKRKNKASCMVAVTAIALLSAANAQDLPAGPGKAEFERICSGCHSVTIVTRQRMTSLQWLGVVSDMAARGAQGNADELHDIVGYLGKNFGPGNSAQPAVPAQTPAPALKPKEPPLTQAEMSKANGLLNANGCLSCHRVGDMGSYLAPDLTEIGAHRSPDQLRAALVSPNKAALPENRSVRLVTQDGATVTGRLLNQDGFSVQLIDSSSQLRAFKKANLREFTIITTNPMPSYADKISDPDLTDLVHYLSSLKGQP